jgi:hypothetical protein
MVNNIEDGKVDTDGYVSVYPKYVRRKSIYKIWSSNNNRSKQNKTKLQISIILFIFFILLLITLLIIKIK